MSLKAELCLLREAWQIFCADDATTRRDAIVRNLRNTILMGGMLALAIWVFRPAEVPAALMYVCLGCMTAFAFCAGLMFDPSVRAMEARVLREHYGDTIRRPL